MEPRRASGDNRRAVYTSPPQIEGKAASRLLDHYTRIAGLSEARPLARERLEADLGGDLATRLVGALAGDHRMPARLLFAFD
jgi:hypothetical protein